MRNKFLKIAGVAVLGVILLCVLLGVFQRPVNRGIWLMENVEALTSGETGGYTFVVSHRKVFVIWGIL